MSTIATTITSRNRLLPKRLEGKGATHLPETTSPLLLVQDDNSILHPKDRGTRPIINLKGLNNFVDAVHFKMEGIHMLKDTLKQGNWMTKVDLKDVMPMVETLAKIQVSSQFNCLSYQPLGSLPRPQDQ